MLWQLKPPVGGSSAALSASGRRYLGHGRRDQEVKVFKDDRRVIVLVQGNGTNSKRQFDNFLY